MSSSLLCCDVCTPLSVLAWLALTVAVECEHDCSIRVVEDPLKSLLVIVH